MQKDTVGEGSIIRSMGGYGAIYSVDAITNSGAVIRSVKSGRATCMSLKVFIRKIESGYFTIPNGLEWAINLSKVKRSGYNKEGEKYGTQK